MRLLTSCERPPADGASPFSLGRLSFGELQPETGVLLLLGEESVETSEGLNMTLYTENSPLLLNHVKNDVERIKQPVIFFLL